MEGSGVVVAVGSDVRSFKVGDAVYGLAFRTPVLPFKPPGLISEYAVIEERFLLPKPPHVSFEEAAALTGSVLTGYQSIRLAIELGGGSGSLEGKTVFMPGALSGTGSVGAQLLKNVFGASTLISTVSTAKVPLVSQHLPGIVDTVIDYKTQDIVRTVGRGSVDVVYNTQWDLVGTFPLLKPKTGVVVSIASIPPPAIMWRNFGRGGVPFWMGWILSLAQLWYDWKLRGTGVKREFVSGNPAARDDLEKTGEIIATGKVKAVMTVVGLADIEAVRRECGKVYSGKGSLGRVVIRIVE